VWHTRLQPARAFRIENRRLSRPGDPAVLSLALGHIGVTWMLPSAKMINIGGALVLPAQHRWRIAVAG
jgi:hypothetical protein